MLQNLFTSIIGGILFPFICLYFVFIYLPYQILKFIFMQKPKEKSRCRYSSDNSEYADIKL
ncbi:hypothetical protein [Campylobacter sputorum]|uniref:hypothetical protein n=1 Tax=Campylobacter sputorum TaxID=206 RepID=UPI00053BEC6A|nr:hypothetical protein [Campylobacter sputorum]